MHLIGPLNKLKPCVLVVLSLTSFTLASSFELVMPASIAAEVENESLPQTRVDDAISAQRAYELSLARRLHLIDIRRPDEWKETGVATTAHTITMHQNMQVFLQKLRKISPSLDGQPIALICARGFRSRYMQRILRNYGVAQVIDVSEGMLGSSSGPGWLNDNLPTKPWTPE